MLNNHGTQLELEIEILKEPHGTKNYKCDRKCLNQWIQTNWKGSYILVTGSPGVGKTSLCEKLARELDKSREISVCKFESIEELREKGSRHFNSHENHELVTIVDNITSSQLDELSIYHTPYTTTVIFSRTLSVEKFDCVVKINGSQKFPTWDDSSSWNNHIEVLCRIPFLFVLFETLFSRNLPRHEIYYLLFSCYINYCLTLQVSLFNSVEEVPSKVEKLLKDLADVAYSCVSKGSEGFIDENQFKKCFYDLGDEVGVVVQTDDDRYKFSFEGSIDCLTAFKLFWSSEEQFDKDTQAGIIKVPHEAMTLYKGMQLCHPN